MFVYSDDPTTKIGSYAIISKVALLSLFVGKK